MRRQSDKRCRAMKPLEVEKYIAKNGGYPFISPMYTRVLLRMGYYWTSNDYRKFCKRCADFDVMDPYDRTEALEAVLEFTTARSVLNSGNSTEYSRRKARRLVKTQRFYDYLVLMGYEDELKRYGCWDENHWCLEPSIFNADTLSQLGMS